MKVLSSDAELEELSRDAGIVKIRPKVGYLVRSEDEVVSVVQEAMRDGMSLTARGGGTSIPSQSVGRGIVLLQDRRLAVSNPDGSVRCEPGLVKSDLNRFLDPKGVWMPVDPSSYLSCTVGGMVSNNSAGIRTPKYGSTIDFVQEVRIVTPEQGLKAVRPLSLEEAFSADAKTKRVASLVVDNWKAIVEEKPRVTKNSSGYRLEELLREGVFDLPKLFVGSEGTLGVITEVTFSTRQRPSSRALLVVDSTLDELDGIVSAFKELAPSAVELVDKSVFMRMKKEERISRYSRKDGDYLVFCELEGTEGLVSEGLDEAATSKVSGYDPLVLTEAKEVTDAWEVRNETLKLAMEVKEGSKVLVPGVEDLAVPPEKLGDLVRLLRGTFEDRGLEYISYGHAADANLHARPLLDLENERKILEDIMEECFEAVWKMGGSITGEHGDGMLRAPYVRRQYPKTYEVMKEIKNVYDPKGVMNPGVKIT